MPLRLRQDVAVIRTAATALSQLRLVLAQTAFALTCSLTLDMGEINPDFFTLVAQILPVLLLAALFEPQEEAAPTNSGQTSPENLSSAQRDTEQLRIELSALEGDFHGSTASEEDPHSTSIDPAELEGLDLEEIMAKVVPKIEAAQGRVDQAKAFEDQAQQILVEAKRNQLQAEHERAVAKAAFDQVRREARGALRASIWGLFVGEAAALYAVASGQHTAFLAVFCGLSVLITFWIITETWIKKKLNSPMAGA